MSTLRIEERLELEAPAERVWAYLVDPGRVAACLPGAAIESTEGERTYHGSMKVKVGPASLTYRGTAEFVEVDADRRHMRLEGKANERSGGGQVQMVMESTVEALSESRTLIVVDVDLKLAGKIVRFGRGMIGVVSERLFQEFGECLSTRLGSEVAAADDEPASGGAPAGLQEPASELGAVGLLLRALWSRLARLFGRSG